MKLIAICPKREPGEGIQEVSDTVPESWTAGLPSSCDGLFFFGMFRV